MAKITVEANQCDVCGHVWLPTGKVAVQCAKCRSRKWNASPEAIGRPVMPLPENYKELLENMRLAPPRQAVERTVEYEE